MKVPYMAFKNKMIGEGLDPAVFEVISTFKYWNIIIINLEICQCLWLTMNYLSTIINSDIKYKNYWMLKNNNLLDSKYFLYAMQ